MRSFLVAASLSILFLTSCDNNNHADIDTSLPATSNSLAPADANILNNENLSETGVLPADDGNQLNQEVKQAPAEVYQAAGLNPPHGQPGHDCAIAVGAPLKGSPTASPAKPAAPMNFSTPTPKPSPIRASGGQRLNPAHGQPGHDCAVEVGAPLG